MGVVGILSFRTVQSMKQWSTLVWNYILRMEANGVRVGT